MATWGDLIAFVRSEYQVTRVDTDEIRVEVEFEDERRQAVVIYREVFDKREEWVQIVSPCGKATDVNLRELLDELGQTAVCGGAIVMGEYVAIRHTLPLANLDINEFTDPLALVAGVADELEEKFIGGDRY
jgi:translation initiation factor 1 (eIF-1/SUI1)